MNNSLPHVIIVSQNESIRQKFRPRVSTQYWGCCKKRSAHVFQLSIGDAARNVPPTCFNSVLEMLQETFRPRVSTQYWRCCKKRSAHMFQLSVGDVARNVPPRRFNSVLEINVPSKRFKSVKEMLQQTLHPRVETDLSNVLSVECRTTQHWYSGARMLSSSWKGLPKPRPWSRWMGAELLPNIWKKMTRINTRRSKGLR